jgi:hypothetical protein
MSSIEKSNSEADNLFSQRKLSDIGGLLRRMTEKPPRSDRPTNGHIAGFDSPQNMIGTVLVHLTSEE